MNVPLTSCGEDTVQLRRALTSGLFPHAALKQPDGAVTSLVCVPFPSSLLSTPPPPGPGGSELAMHSVRIGSVAGGGSVASPQGTTHGQMREAACAKRRAQYVHGKPVFLP